MFLALTSIAAACLVWRVYRVRRVRFDRVNGLLAKYRHLVDGDLEDMTYQEAEQICKTHQLYDFPWLVTVSLSFALFQTYAIPSISKVLKASEQLGSLAEVGRRAEDTVILTVEPCTEGLDSVRGSTAIARINYLHGRWGSRITRDDMLFTLSLFVFEPITLSSLYEWRALTSLEKHARYVFWREFGARMGIADIPDTYAALWEWKEAYMHEKMWFEPSNQEVGEATVQLLLRPFPAVLRPLGRQCAYVLLPDVVRSAFGWGRASPAVLYTLVPALLRFRALIVGNLLYPRAKPPGFERNSEVLQDDGTTTVVREGYVFEPWYVRETGSPLGLLFAWLRPGEQWKSRGWQNETVGPEKLRSSGVERTVKEAEKMREQAARGCPFFVK